VNSNSKGSGRRGEEEAEAAAQAAAKAEQDRLVGWYCQGAATCLHSLKHSPSCEILLNRSGTIR
jgi:hypothetical protein